MREPVGRRGAAGRRAVARVGAALLLGGCLGPVVPPPWPVPPPPGVERELAAAAPATRALYLADLFDGARLAGDDASRELLFRALAAPPGRGPEATVRALEALGERARSARLEDLAALLEDDLAELEGGDQAFAMADRRKRAAAGGPGAAHAALSLYGACAGALADAIQAAPWLRAQIADQCLRALTDHPVAASYLAADARARPPDPPWRILFAGMARLAADAERAAPRLAPLCARLAAERARVADAIAQAGIEPPDPAEWGPRLPAGDPSLPPYDRSPWVAIEGDLVAVGRARFTTRDHPLVADLERMLTVARVAGGRARLALFVPEQSSADVADSLGELARRVGADAIELVLAAPSTWRPPPGDPQAAAPPPFKLVVLPLALHADEGRAEPRGLLQRPTSLTLLVAPEGVTLLADDGALPLGPIAGIDRRLAELARAFPDEAAVRIAIDPTARYRDLVDTARAARARFRRVVLVEVPHAPRKEGLAVRVERRAAARVAVRGARRVDEKMVRGCYLDAIDRLPALAATVRVQPGPRVSGAGDEELARCLVERVAGVRGEPGYSIELAPR